MSERKNYCRACGENKGHNFGSCKNTARLREIIRLQDEELSSLREKGKAHEEALRELDDWREHAAIQTRIIRALLGLAEIIQRGADDTQ